MLVVEDYAPMRGALRQFLNSELPGCDLAEAADGAAALAAVRERRPQLVLMDVSLPDANGLELTEKITKLFPETRVIVVTQFEGTHYREHARAAGAFAYVTKDRLYQELMPLVARVVESAPRAIVITPSQ